MSCIRRPDGLLDNKSKQQASLQVVLEICWMLDSDDGKINQFK